LLIVFALSQTIGPGFPGDLEALSSGFDAGVYLMLFSADTPELKKLRDTRTIEAKVLRGLRHKNS